MSYIINTRTNEIVAVTSASAAAGECSYSFNRTAEAIDASREFNLVNASTGKISNAKKWDAAYKKMQDCPVATQINASEFFVS